MATGRVSDSAVPPVHPVVTRGYTVPIDRRLLRIENAPSRSQSAIVLFGHRLLFCAGISCETNRAVAVSSLLSFNLPAR